MISALVTSSIALAGGDIAPVEPVVETPVMETNSWKNEISIYGWLPTISATTLFSNSGTGSVDAEQIIDDLKMVFMGGYSGRNDKWSVYGDLIYVDLGDSKSHTFKNDTTARVNWDMKAMLINAGVGYNVLNTGDGILDIIAGVRYLDLKVDINAELLDKNFSHSKDFTDFVLGVKGHMNINENWYVPYEADIGTGDSEVSWQLFAGLGYRYDWGDVKLGYRYLKYDMEDDAIVEDLTLNGAVLGVSIKF